MVPSSDRTWPRRLGLVALLVLAATLRFTGLGWGLRHRPPLDERFFVSNAALMLARGDLDHGFYQYPGLFYYVLAPVLLLVHDPFHNPEAFEAARALVATFSVVTVALGYFLGRRLFGTAAGLVAAALVAVSPLEIRTAHEVRPDVLLECATLWAFFVFRRLGTSRREDAAAGVAIGAATALKFSGALLGPSYVLQRMLSPGPKLRRMLLAGIVSLAAFAVLSPYTFLRGSASLQGMDDQLSFHYVDRPAEMGFFGNLRVYWGVVTDALGLPALALAAAGLAVGRRQWRTWLPLLLLPLVILLVFSTATITQDRFILPAVTVIAILSGPAVEAVARRPLAASLLGAAVVALPLRTSIDYVSSIRLPITRDVAADWIESHYREGQVAVTVNAFLGLDPARFEPLPMGLLTQKTRLQALQATLVVVGPGVEPGGLRGLDRVFVAEPATRYSGNRIRVFAVPETLRPRYERLDLAGARFSASQADNELDRLRDGDVVTAWRTHGDQSPGDWVQIDLPEPRVLGRIEIVPPPDDPEEAADELQVFVTEGRPKLSRCPTLPGRPSFSQQRPPVSQVFLFPGVRAVSIRLVQVGRRARPWAISELRIDAYKP
jgi:Dolichyl-phosphate-mannose-protein mannosyltransferase